MAFDALKDHTAIDTTGEPVEVIPHGVVHMRALGPLRAGQIVALGRDVEPIPTIDTEGEETP